MEYQIEIREIEPVRVAYIKYKGFAPEANKVFPQCVQVDPWANKRSALFQLLVHEPRNKNRRYGTLCTDGGHPCGKWH